MTTNPGNNQDISSLLTALLGANQQGIGGLSPSPQTWGNLSSPPQTMDASGYYTGWSDQQPTQGMKSGGGVQHFEDGGPTLGDISGVSDLGLGDFTMPDMGSGSSTPDFSALNGDLGLGGLDLSALTGSSNNSVPTDQQLSDLMNQAYGTAATGGEETLNLNELLNPSDQSNAETARLLAANTAAGNSGISNNTTDTRDPLTGLTAAETQAQQDRVNAFTSGLTNGGNQNFGTGAVTPSNLSSYQDTLKNTMDNGGGFTSGYQTVGDNKIMVHDDGTATGINVVSGQTFTLPADTVKTMTTAGVLNSASSGYNTSTGGTNIAPGGGTTVTNTDGSKTTTFSDGSKVTQATDGTYTTTGKPGSIANPSGTLPQSTSTSTPKTPTTTANQPAANSTSSILALLALMALMDKGSSGSGMTIPLFNAQRGVIPGQVNYTKAAGGGMMGGGISSLDGHLGGYSDGGRLLRGPGDGVSDDIPATIGGKEPARLADGEFVVPARIVSELGNGSTEAGARKLYAMMDRVQKDRSKAKDIAADTKADKHLPA